MLLDDVIATLTAAQYHRATGASPGFTVQVVDPYAVLVGHFDPDAPYVRDAARYEQQVAGYAQPLTAEGFVVTLLEPSFLPPMLDVRRPLPPPLLLVDTAPAYEPAPRWLAWGGPKGEFWDSGHGNIIPPSEGGAPCF